MSSNILIPGVIHVTGPHDTGKTTFALENGSPPDHICFFGGDVKERATIQALDGIVYHDLNELAANRDELQFFVSVKGIIDDIRDEEFDTIIFDTWDRFGRCFHPYVARHMQQFRSSWSPNGRIKGAQIWQEAQQFEARVLNRLSQAAISVIVVSHLKDFYLNGVKTDKMVPDASRTLDRISNFRIWLEHNPNSSVPIGLVLKRIDQKRYIDGLGLRTVSVLPRKIVPRPDDESLWDTIRWYFNNPVGLREPTEDEIPNEFELAILDGTLTTEQKHMLQLMLGAGAIDGGIEPAEEIVKPVSWQELLSMTGKTLDDIGGIEVATALSQDDIEALWEELK